MYYAWYMYYAWHSTGCFSMCGICIMLDILFNIKKEKEYAYSVPFLSFFTVLGLIFAISSCFQAVERQIQAFYKVVCVLLPYT